METCLSWIEYFFGRQRPGASQLTKHPQLCAPFSFLRLGQRGDATDVLQLVLQAHVVDGQHQLRARGAVDADTFRERRARLDVPHAGVLVVHWSPLAGPRHLFWESTNKEKKKRYELHALGKRACLLASGSAHVKPMDHGAAGALGGFVQAADLGGSAPEHVHSILHLHHHIGPCWKSQWQRPCELSAHPKNRCVKSIHIPYFKKCTDTCVNNTLVTVKVKVMFYWRKFKKVYFKL